MTKITRKLNTNFKENLKILNTSFCSLPILKLAIMIYITTEFQLYLVHLEKIINKTCEANRLKGKVHTLQANHSLITNTFLIKIF